MELFFALPLTALFFLLIAKWPHDKNASYKHPGLVCLYYCQYEQACNSLEKWLSARPHLHTGDCAYACALLRQMLFAYNMLVLLGVEDDQETVNLIHTLLNDHAPPDDPPTAGRFLY